VNLPEAVIFLTMEPKTEDDQAKLGQGLRKLMAEDPTFRVSSGTQTGQTMIRGMSELHLEGIVNRLKHEFNVDAAVGKPQVVYKETITQPAEGAGRYVRQIGGQGHYAHAKIRLFPGERGAGYIFENQIVRGAIPTQYIKPVDEGIQEALTRGVLCGYPVDDVRIELYDGSFHDIDSSEAAFKIAGAMAFDDAAKKAKPILLEPIMSIEVIVPDEYTGSVIDDISSRRGRIEGMELTGATQIIKASVPLSEMFSYGTNVRSRTQGCASYSMHFDRYELRGGPDIDDDDRSAHVGAPRTPAPKGKSSGVALPEPP
jgi:elongation factor G